MKDDERLISESYELARSAAKNGNHPFGALIALGGEILAEAENTVFSDADCTCHAELNLIRRAQTTVDAATLSACTLYASTEPCAMCAGAIYWAGIRRVVFGCSAGQLRKIAGQSLEIAAGDVYVGAQESVEIVGPILEEEGAEIHRGFWKAQIDT